MRGNSHTLQERIAQWKLSIPNFLHEFSSWKPLRSKRWSKREKIQLAVIMVMYVIGLATIWAVVGKLSNAAAIEKKITVQAAAQAVSEEAESPSLVMEYRNATLETLPDEDVSAFDSFLNERSGFTETLVSTERQEGEVVPMASEGSNASFCSISQEGMAAFPNQTTVVMTCPRARMNTRYPRMTQLAALPFVSQVIVIVESGLYPIYEKFYSLDPLVVMIDPGHSLPMLQLLPWSTLVTPSLALVDCLDMETSLDFIDFAFQVWSSNGGRLVGTTPLRHFLQPGTHDTWKTHYGRTDSGTFSLVRGSPIVVGTGLMLRLACLVPAGVLKLAESSSVCQDVALNFLAANHSKAGPILVRRILPGSQQGPMKTRRGRRNRTRPLRQLLSASEKTAVPSKVMYMKRIVLGRALPEGWTVWDAEMEEQSSHCFAAMVRLWGSLPLVHSNDYIEYCAPPPAVSPPAKPPPPPRNQTRETHSKFTYAFLVFSHGLLKIVAVAAQCLRLTGTPHDIVLLTGGNTSLAEEGRGPVPLLQFFTSVRSVEYVRNPHFHNAYAKLHLWALVEYERVVYLDTDVVVVENIDQLFSRRQFAAAPDVAMATTFNSGVMVLDPCLALHSRLVAMAATQISNSGDDQGFLNGAFEGWYSMEEEHRLPFKYNAIIHFPSPPYILPAGMDVNRAHEYLGPLAVIHFANPWFKPWDSRGSNCSVWCSAWQRVYRRLRRNSWRRLDPARFQVMDGIQQGWLDPWNPFASPDLRAARSRLPAGRGKGRRKVRHPALPAGTGRKRLKIGQDAMPAGNVSKKQKMGQDAVPAGRARKRQKMGQDAVSAGGTSKRQVISQDAVPAGRAENGQGPVKVKGRRKVKSKSTGVRKLRKGRPSQENGKVKPVGAARRGSNTGRSGQLSHAASRRLLDATKAKEKSPPAALRREPWLWNRSLLEPPLPDRYLEPSIRTNYSREVFATMMTSASEAFQVGVWGLSYREHHYGYGKKDTSTRSTLLLVLSTVPERAWIPYKGLFQRVLVVDPVSVVVDGGERQLDGRFAVLYLWSLDQYERIVFVDSLSLFWDNCNGILDWRSFAAAPFALPGDWFNWKTMVITPDIATFQDMGAKLSLSSGLYPRRSVGIFLNAYFNTWYSSSAYHRLPLSYAVDVMLKPFALVHMYPWKIVSFDELLPPYANLSTWQRQPRYYVAAMWRTTFCRLKLKLRPSKLQWICEIMKRARYFKRFRVLS